MTVKTAINDDPVLRTFVAELGTLWPDVEPLCLDPGEDLSSLPPRPAETDCDASELDALLAGWRHFGSSERTVLYAALSYLNARVSTTALEARNSDLVIDATVRALLRGPRT